MSLRFRELGLSDAEWMSLSQDERSAYLGTSFKGTVSMTDQSQAAEADINSIVRRFQLTGNVPLRQDVAMDADADALERVENFDLQTGLNRVNEARFAFDRLPLSVRKRFGFDPLEFSTAIADPEKGPKLAHELGLTVVIPDDKIPRVEISNIADLLKKESDDVTVSKGP